MKTDLTVSDIVTTVNLPTAMLPEEQVGWMFHSVCMKDASTWLVPLAIERCCERGAQVYTQVKKELPVSAVPALEKDVSVLKERLKLLFFFCLSCQTAFEYCGLKSSAACTTVQIILDNNSFQWIHLERLPVPYRRLSGGQVKSSK